MSTLEKAIEVALNAHSGQVDKAGKKYILHPLRLMTKANNDDEQIVSVLHDVVEDSDISINDLEEMGFTNDITRSIDAISKRRDENYYDYINRVAYEPLARSVKILDLKDNMRLLRLNKIRKEDYRRMSRYLKVYYYLKHIQHITEQVTIGNFNNKDSELCARVFLIPAGISFPGSLATNGSAGTVHLIFFNGYSESIPPTIYEKVHKTIESSDSKCLYEFNQKWAPFYCPKCNANYGTKVWKTIPNEEYQIQKAVCPKNHCKIIYS